MERTMKMMRTMKMTMRMTLLAVRVARREATSLVQDSPSLVLPVEPTDRTPSASRTKSR